MNDEPESAHETSPSLGHDVIFELLASERRRHVLSVLGERGSLALPDLADEVALREHDTALAQVPEDAVLRVYLSLWHVHVPKLTDADVLAHDRERDIVDLTERAAAVEEFLAIETTADGD